MIEKILDFHVNPDGTAYYQVKWKTTWERADSLAQFSDLLDQFWSQVKKASLSNIYNNTSMNRSDPMISKRLPNIQTNKTNLQQPNRTQQQAPSTPTSRSIPQSPKTPSTPVHQQLQQQPQQQQQKQQMLQDQLQLPNFSQLQQPSHQNMGQMPQQMQNMGQQIPGGGRSTVVIDSDDDDDVVQVNPPAVPNVMPFNNQMNQNNIKMEDFEQKPQVQQFPQQFQQPPMFPNMQQQQFFMNPTNANGTGRGSGRGRGRGRGGASLTKRKLGMPPSSPTLKAPKTEQASVKNEDGTMPKVASSNWKDHFEVLENYVDGQKVSCTYKCRLCGTTIAQQSNCGRHLKKHFKT